MPNADTQVTCKKCGDFLLWKNLRRHHQDKHGLVVKARGEAKLKLKDVKQDALATIRSIDEQTSRAIKQLEFERDQMQIKLREMDNIIVKLKERRIVTA